MRHVEHFLEGRNWAQASSWRFPATVDGIMHWSEMTKRKIPIMKKVTQKTTLLLFTESGGEVVPPSRRRKKAKSAALAFLRQNKSCIALRLTQLNWSALLTALFHLVCIAYTEKRSSKNAIGRIGPSGQILMKTWVCWIGTGGHQTIYPLKVKFTFTT